MKTLSIPGLWFFGEQDMQIPVKFCIEQLNTLKSQGEAFTYTSFSTVHNILSVSDTKPFDISIQWTK